VRRYCIAGTHPVRLAVDECIDAELKGANDDSQNQTATQNNEDTPQVVQTKLVSTS